MTRSYAKALLAFVPLLAALMLQGCDTDDAQASVAGAPPTVLARGVVDVEGGLVSIRPQRTGQLVRIDAALGQDVSRGTILATLQGSAEYAEPCNVARVVPRETSWPSAASILTS